MNFWLSLSTCFVCAIAPVATNAPATVMASIVVFFSIVPPRVPLHSPIGIARRGLSNENGGRLILFLLRRREHVAALHGSVTGGESLFIHAQERSFADALP